MSETSYWFRFVLAALAAWRVTHLLVSEDGPFDLIVRFRARLGTGLLGKLMDCFYCMSLWVSMPAAFLLAHGFVEWLVVWLALSGAACLLERVGQESVVVRQIPEPGERETEHGMLRSETRGTNDFTRSNIDAEHTGANGQLDAESFDT